MQEAIVIAIEKQARKLIERQRKKKFTQKKYYRRFTLRTDMEAKVARERDPAIWAMHPHFDPKYCIKHSKYLAKVIWKKIQNRTYEVTPAINYKIPKESGGERDIMIFSIPDSAIANLFNRKLRDRNRNLQSPFCYSYRKDRTIFDAVLQTKSLLQDNKVYVIQYDFSKYFDSINHDYINFLLDDERKLFYISPAEKYIVEKFLKHKFALSKDYINKNFEVRRRGVPQGSSLSLFLSNIAAHELDKELEKSNGSFVRFADDVVCTSQSFVDAVKIEAAFKRHCHYSGISINYQKSPGICLLTGNSKSSQREFFIDEADIGKLETINEFDYIGHKFTRGEVKISTRGLRRVKARISKIIYNHLLHGIKRADRTFNPKRVGKDFYDWDLVTCINEIRKYMYGGLREETLNSFLKKNERINRFKGLMSFYPLVTSVEQFAALDGWLISVLRRALRERAKILKSKFGIILPSLKDGDLISGKWYELEKGRMHLETNAPSFVLAWRAARKAFRQYGLTDFQAPSYYSTLFNSY